MKKKARYYILTNNAGVSLKTLVNIHSEYCIKNNVTFRVLTLSVYNPLHYIYLFLLGSFTNVDIIFFGPLYFHSFVVRKSLLIIHDLGSISKSIHSELIFKIYSIIFLKNKLVAVSNQTRLEILGLLPHVNVVVLPNPNRFSYCSSRKIMNEEHFCGLINILIYNQTENKNFEYVLSNLSCKDNYFFNIVGIYNFHKYSEILNSKGFRFKFHEGVPDEIIKELNEDSTLLLFLSKYEGFGMPTIEAQHFGLPVIASDLNLFKNEVLLNSAYFVDISRNQDLNVHIDKVMSSYSFYSELSRLNAARFSLRNYFVSFNLIIASKN